MYLSRVTLKPDIGQNSQLGRLLQSNTYGTHQLLWDLFDQEKRDFLYREEVAKEQLKQHAGAKGEPVYYVLSVTRPRESTPLFTVESKEYRPQFQAGQRLSFCLTANPVVTRDKKRCDLVMDEQLVFFRQACKEIGLSCEGSKGDLKRRLMENQRASAVTDYLCSYLSQSRCFADAVAGHSVDVLLGLATQEAVSRRLIQWLAHNPSRDGLFSIAEQEVEDDDGDREITVPVFQWQRYRIHPLPQKDASARKQQARFLSVDISGELIVKDPEGFLTMINNGIGPAKAFGCGLMLIRPR
ncbi:type I-E CRISPR-associated protein Cas6/Cse3/CasE [Spongiibacter taiwanensis]|uniref:type I-E CRISPR-associated protein Cas6/Cse3/CasE n=1 Tax=Spongiibacter taiwanensis TaxID=1748242 RepID=UPI002034C78E|nr:type I-E CRISPR-associated protein Cas6/Cse3/CasE [Spongiibacter taiwanensis]USA43090.1 type I-E CRISPR-associated protein Cas6/Cse3/CasE [Spongiibacter taiwanensis]